MDNYLDYEFYRKCNPEFIKKSDEYILNQWNERGLKENRLPNYDIFKLTYPNFNVKFYKNNYQDLQKLNDYQLIGHYWRFGNKEKRICEIDINDKQNKMNYDIKIENNLQIKNINEEYINEQPIIENTSKKESLTIKLNNINNEEVIILKLHNSNNFKSIINIYVDSNKLKKSEQVLESEWVTVNFLDPKINKSFDFLKIYPSNNINKIEMNRVNRNNLEHNFNIHKNNINKNTYKFEKPKIKIAIVADEFTFNNVNLDFDCEYISSNDISKVDVKKFNLFLCESCWHGIDGSWKYGSKNYNKNITELVNLFKNANIKTLYYNKEDPYGYDYFKELTKYFDVLITTDNLCIEKYKKTNYNQLIFAYPFAINPIVHNPMNKNINKTLVAFPGSYYSNFKDRVDSMVKNLDKINKITTIDIYDRNYILTKIINQVYEYKNHNINYEFPEKFFNNIKPCLTAEQIYDIVYKGYKFVINFNTISDSDTMCSRRAIELAGCGTNIISDYSRALKNIFGNDIIYFDDVNTLSDLEKFDDINLNLYYKTHLNYTFKNMMKTVLKHIGLNIDHKHNIVIIINPNTKLESDILTNFKVLYLTEYVENDYLDFNKLFILDEENYYSLEYVNKFILPLEFTNNDIYVTYNKSDYFKETSNNFSSLVFLINSHKTGKKIFINDNLDNFKLVIPMVKTKLLFTYRKDINFADEIVKKLKDDFDVTLIEWDSNTKIKLDNYKIIFCEWAGENAIWYSKNIKSNQKLIIRLHRWELFSPFFFEINWSNVYKIIFISHEIQNLAIERINNYKLITKQNFDENYYNNNNDEFFDKIEINNNYDHFKKFIKNTNKVPNFKIINMVNDEMNFNDKCITIFNYVKSSMFNNLNKTTESKFNIGMIGAIPKLKRLDIAIDIINNLVKINPKYKLHILSKSIEDVDWLANQKNEIEYFKNIKVKINNLKLNNNVIFEKFNNEPHIWLQKIGYLLSVSDIEGSHQAVAEAMATGAIPFIYGNALKKYKLDSIYPKNLCYYEESIDILCNQIINYTNNDDIRDKLSNECKIYSKNNFNIDKIYENIKNYL